MKFTPDKARYLAKLARLDPDHPALEHLVEDMRHMLNMVEQINSVDTTDVAPLRHPLELSGLARPDLANQQNQRSSLLANAPATVDGLFLVPQVIE